MQSEIFYAGELFKIKFLVWRSINRVLIHLLRRLNIVLISFEQRHDYTWFSSTFDTFCGSKAYSYEKKIHLKGIIASPASHKPSCLHLRKNWENLERMLDLVLLVTYLLTDTAPQGGMSIRWSSIYLFKSMWEFLLSFELYELRNSRYLFISRLEIIFRQIFLALELDEADGMLGKCDH